LDPVAAMEGVAGLDAVLANRLPDEVYLRAERLKAVFVPFAGLNHLPAGLLAEKGVRVFNVHGNAEEVAERALAMTLDFMGRVTEFHNDLKGELWHGFWVGKGSEDFWSSLFRRKVAVFGVGAIGQVLARLLKAFDCEVTGYRRRGDAPVPPNFDRIEGDLAAAVAGAELLFVTLPLTPETKGLFSRELLMGAKGKFLVNVGRGEVVDEEGLYLALKEGVLRGAAIDTWYTYPQGGAVRGAPSRYPIHGLPNVILSPHVAGSAHEAAAANADQAIENIAEWLETGNCRREADIRAMY
ncbi:MAG: hypothetical protein JNG85_12015, partial [Spirochaetaceae bacterium]|nr:hypothetical protein [Spirochaetaceae bacterium]